MDQKQHRRVFMGAHCCRHGTALGRGCASAFGEPDMSEVRHAMRHFPSLPEQFLLDFWQSHKSYRYFRHDAEDGHNKLEIYRRSAARAGQELKPARRSVLLLKNKALETFAGAAR
jgi:hypothetical protein